MHSGFANYLPEVGRGDLFLMHVQRVRIAWFVFAFAISWGQIQGQTHRRDGS